MSAQISVAKPIQLWPYGMKDNARVENVGTGVLYLSNQGSVSEWDVSLNPGFGVEWYGECWGMSIAGTVVNVSPHHGDIYQTGDAT